MGGIHDYGIYVYVQEQDYNHKYTYTLCAPQRFCELLVHIDHVGTSLQLPAR